MNQEPGDQEIAERLAHEFNDLNHLIRQLVKEQNQNQSTNTQTINVNAGGWGVLIALIMVAFLAGLNLSQSAGMSKQSSDINEIRRKQDRDDDYVMSIFRMVPEIKQKIDAEKAKEKVH